MDIKKRLILSNTITVVIPFIITILAGLLFIFISSKVFNRDISYDNFEKLIAIKTQLSDTSSEIWKQNSGDIEDIKFQQYLSRKLASINGELILVKNNSVIYASRDISKIDVEKCLIEANKKSLKKLVKIDNISYIIEGALLKFKDEVSGTAVILIPTGQDPEFLQKFIIFVIAVFIITFIAVNLFMSYLFSERILKPLAL